MSDQREQTNDRDVAVRLGSGTSRWTIILRDYCGSRHIGGELIEAIDNYAKVRWGANRHTEFDYIEVLR